MRGKRPGGAARARSRSSRIERADARGRPPPRPRSTSSEVSREQLGALEAELSYTKENLQAAIEELETSNEELQAANEELLASNEELQSTNEELQSVNEELYTVNAEYQRKIAELTELPTTWTTCCRAPTSAPSSSTRSCASASSRRRSRESFNLLPQDVGRPIETFTHSIDHPELVDDLKRVLASGEPRRARAARPASGAPFFLRILPYRAKGAVDGVVLTLIDVSGLKAAEDALFHERYLLNSLLSSVPDAIYFKDARGRFIRANHADGRRGSGSTIRARRWARPASSCPATSAALARAPAGRGRAAHRRRRSTTSSRSASAPTAATSGTSSTRLPLRDAAGEIVGIIGIFRDVTEQKRAEEKIQEAVRRRDQFLAMLSHELRNPLGAIVTATALLKDGRRDARAAASGCSTILERQSQQMARLLDDLLEASRVTQNKIELRKQRRSTCARWSKDAADAVREPDGSARRRASRSSSTPSRCCVDGDPARLQQIHVNLLNNAAKYTPRGGHVQLERAARGRRGGRRACATTASGIPKDMLDDVFELFVQSHRTLDRAGGRARRRAHAGARAGRACTAARSPRTATARARAASSWCGCRCAPPRAGPMRAESRLRAGAVPRAARASSIVEDNDDSREMLCELLTRAGFECHVRATTASRGSS